MTTPSCGPGFFGKLPMRGDFVNRRLTPWFIKPWDKWLQMSLEKSKEQLGTQWVETYLSSPMWRFGLSPGVCGKNTKLGVLMPSVDQVGRYFPLTVVATINKPHHLAPLFTAASQWFEQAENLLLTVLDEGADFNEFDSKLEQLLPSFMDSIENSPTQSNKQSLKATLKTAKLSCKLTSLDELKSSQSDLNRWLLNHSLPDCTMWCTSGSELVEPSFFLFGGLPDPTFSLLTATIVEADPAQKNTLIFPENGNIFASSSLCLMQEEAAAVENPKRWHSCALSDVGKVRKINEDAFLERSDLGLWMVADGMGGHHAGDVASRTAVVALNDIAIPAGGVYKDIADLITEVTIHLQQANNKLFLMARDLSPETVIGSTVVAMLALGEQCAAVWSGDSRLYQFRDGVMTQITRDHSLINEMIQRGQGNLEELTNSRISNVVTQALGVETELRLETILFTARKNDLYLLCSDGLTEDVTEAEIGNLLAETEFCTIPRKLIDLALSYQAKDNITVIVIQRK